MKDTEPDELYIGYLPQLPVRIKRLMRVVITVLCILSVMTALIISAGFALLPESYFEFGQEREFAGIIIEDPYPAILVSQPLGDSDKRTLTRYLLAGKGKHAADVAGFKGKQVKLRGTLIHRNQGAMIEISPGSIELIGANADNSIQTEDLGIFTLTGEIVDSKCYLGVMNPGRTKVHRDCAVRCISGGIPPLFAAVDSEGNEIALLLTSAVGEAVNQSVLDMIGEPVEITGHVFRQAGQLSLRADPKLYKRLN